MFLRLQGPNNADNNKAATKRGVGREQAYREQKYRGLCRFWPPLCDLLARWRHDAFRSDPETLEVQTGAMAVALGLWLVFLPHHVAGRPSNFSLMVLKLWPAPVWVLLFLLVGTAQILALKRRWLGSRCACAMIGFWLWLFVAVLLTLEGLSGPSVAIFPVIALSEAWVYLRLRAHSDVPSCHGPCGSPPHTNPDLRERIESGVIDSGSPSCGLSTSSSDSTASPNDSDAPTKDRTPVQRT